MKKKVQVIISITVTDGPFEFQSQYTEFCVVVIPAELYQCGCAVWMKIAGYSSVSA